MKTIKTLFQLLFVFIAVRMCMSDAPHATTTAPAASSSAESLLHRMVTP